MVEEEGVLILDIGSVWEPGITTLYALGTSRSILRAAMANSDPAPSQKTLTANPSGVGMLHHAYIPPDAVPALIR
ncbi:hypothetical protein HYALB_00003079 [Hymenoscyphus albidus]|uniref:Uncharacterized protein n=1 Tax=Hymenoscyphus albidus TaxID=595503 RepID=A0A9N9LZL7_9HELO|nr:hypothetical protein HYALB_00003079 [Hymenoscyphus albidus]